jgi:hypothetical protein
MKSCALILSTTNFFALPALAGGSHGDSAADQRNTLSQLRASDRGPVEFAIIQQLDALRSHLARSAFMSAWLQLERARVASETLALLGLPTFVFDDRGKVLAANQLIEAPTGHVRWRAQASR